MWDILITGFDYVKGFLGATIDIASTTTALALLIGAIAFYVYSFIDGRVPRVVIAPVIGILCFTSAWIFAAQETKEYERKQCDIRNAAALKDLNDRYLSVAASLRASEARYNADKAVQDRQHTEERSSLLDTIKRLEAAEDAANSKLDAERSKNETQPESRPSVVYLPSSRCFSTSVPPDIMRSINKAGRSQ